MTVQIYFLLGLAWLFVTFFRLSYDKDFRKKFSNLKESLVERHGKASATFSMVIGVILASLVRILAWPVFVTLFMLHGGKRV